MHGAVVDVFDGTRGVAGRLTAIDDLAGLHLCARTVDKGEVAHIAGKADANPIGFGKQIGLLIGQAFTDGGGRVEARVCVESGCEALHLLRAAIGYTSAADAIADAIVERSYAGAI